MSTIDSQINDILNLAKCKAEIVGHFQYGHNLLQTAVQIDEIFSMLDTILADIINVIGDVIPDINLAPYKDGYIDSTRANLCWIELKENYYGLILNTHRGIKFREFDEVDMQSLLLNGQVSSWYLISKIQNLSYLLATDRSDSTNNISQYFKVLIKDIVERFIIEHESSKLYHPAGEINVDELKRLFASLQIQNTNSITPSNELTQETGTVKWDSSIIKTSTNDICWQTASNMPLKKVTPDLAKYIIDSKYLDRRADVEAFLEETNKKYKNNSSIPNVFCFLSRESFTYAYDNLNYVVECQLRGYIEVEYENGEKETIYPDTQPIVINKGKNDISILTIIKLDNDIVKKVSRVNLDESGTYLKTMFLMCNFIGVIKKTDE